MGLGATLQNFFTTLFSGTIIGGTTTTSDLTLQTTTAAGTTGADMHFLVGNNGGTEAMTILNNGNVGIGINSPTNKIHIQTTAVTSTREVLLKATVSDGGNDAFYIVNGTSTDNQFAPTFSGYVDSASDKYSINFRGMTIASKDASDSSVRGIINFETLITDSATDPNNGNISAIINRKLLTIYNYNTNILTIIPSGNVGLLTLTPSYILSLGGNSTRTIGMERHTTANTAGNSLTLLSGSATTGATNKNGGDLILSSATSTGTGTSNVSIKTAPAGTTGTSDNAPVEHLKILGSGATQFGDIGGGNYSEFEADGTYKMNGNATVFDDIYPSSVTVAVGTSAPSFTAYNGNLKAYEFVGAATSKEMHLGFQLYHSYKHGTDISPHIHLYIPNNNQGGVIKFGLEYTWTNIDQVGAVTPLTIYGTLTVGANAGILNNAIIEFTDITGTGKTMSSILMCRLFRDPTDNDDTFGSSVWLKSADIHTQRDSLGSHLEYTK